MFYRTQDIKKQTFFDRIKIFFEPEYYRVDKNEVEGDNTSAQKDLKLLAIDPNNPRYVFHFINIDNNKDAKLFIKIKDESNFSGVDQDYFEAKNQKVAGFNPQSFSFK